MTRSLKAAIALYCFVGSLLILGGANYLLQPEYLAYHEKATQIPWEALGPEHRGTYLGLMKGGGAGGVTVGLTLILLSTFGLRQGVGSAFWILPVLSLTFLATQNYATYAMNSMTQGGPPIQAGLTLTVLVAVAAALSHLGRPSEHEG